MVSGLVVVETAQLRSAALAMERASQSFQEVARALPIVVPGMPSGVSTVEADLAGVAAGVRELARTLLDESGVLRARANEVDTAEQGVWKLPSGQAFCGCTLPTGEVAAIAVSATTDVGPPAGAPDVAGVTYVEAPLTVSTIGSGSDSLFPSFTVTNDGPGLSTLDDADIEAGADRMAQGIADLVGPGSGGPVPSGGPGFPTLFQASDPGLQTIPGDGRAIYTGPMGTEASDYVANHPGEVGRF